METEHEHDHPEASGAHHAHTDPHGGHGAHGGHEGHGDHAGMFRRRFWWSLLLTVPVVAEAGSVVPPNDAVDVVVDLYDLPGEVGVVDLFLYSNRGGHRTYRLSAPLEWEPWDKRFRIRPLSSRVVPVKKIASQEKRKHERRSYESAKRRERQKEFAEAAWRRAEELTRKVRDNRTAAPEKRVAVLAGEHMGPAPRRRRDDGSERLYVPEMNGDPAQKKSPLPEPERRLDFPDEF